MSYFRPPRLPAQSRRPACIPTQDIQAAPKIYSKSTPGVNLSTNRRGSHSLSDDKIVQQAFCETNTPPRPYRLTGFVFFFSGLTVGSPPPSPKPGASFCFWLSLNTSASSETCHEFDMWTDLCQWQEKLHDRLISTHTITHLLIPTT